VLAVQHEGFGALDALLVAFEHIRTDCFERKLRRRTRQRRACGQANQVENIGHLGGFVVIVDAPDQTAFLVAPSSEIFQVDVTHRQQRGRVGEIGAYIEDRFRPAPVSRAQEGEGAVAHPFMLLLDVAFDDGAMLLGLQPALVFAVCRSNAH
jgi:hypothetical protein